MQVFRKIVRVRDKGRLLTEKFKKRLNRIKKRLAKTKCLLKIIGKCCKSVV